jgi:glutamate--cysteine ligase
VSSLFDLRLKKLSDARLGPLLARGLKGLEKESLRVTRDGRIAQTPHPPALGSTLTHPYITTDYSEALLEFRTPPCRDIRETLAFLTEVHQFTHRHLDEELIWSASMPCRLEGEESIPIAQYGRSNVGHMKHVYRRGLAHRYGKAMQAIAGVHFNYSLPDEFWPLFQDQEGGTRPLGDFVSEAYFGLIRNFQRLSWLVLYLFGASPTAGKSFTALCRSGFPTFDLDTDFGPNATSLRMSDIGYKNREQAHLHASYNNLAEYVASLTEAIETPDPDYERIGVKVDGEYRQLNDHVLQIENEYYSFVRPKQIARSGEKPTLALKRRGVQYVEIRALDVSPFDPIGVNETDMRFLEAFLILCLLEEGPPMDALERKSVEHNQGTVACCGREPGLRLHAGDELIPLKDWAKEIFDKAQGVCELLDAGGKEPLYLDALERQREKLENPETLPSARVLAGMRARKESFYAFGLRLSEEHGERLKNPPLPKDRMEYFDGLARTSLLEQKAFEEADTLSFDEYLRRYFAQVL